MIGVGKSIPALEEFKNKLIGRKKGKKRKNLDSRALLLEILF